MSQRAGRKIQAQAILKAGHAGGVIRLDARADPYLPGAETSEQGRRFRGGTTVFGEFRVEVIVCKYQSKGLALLPRKIDGRDVRAAAVRPHVLQTIRESRDRWRQTLGVTPIPAVTRVHRANVPCTLQRQKHVVHEFSAMHMAQLGGDLDPTSAPIR